MKHQWSVNGVINSLDAKVLLQCNINPTPQYCTVQIAADLTNAYLLTPGPQIAGICPIDARITWSTSGNRATRIISVCNGATISGLAETVQVEIYPRVILAGSTWPGPGQSLPVSIQVAPGVRPNSNQPPTWQSDSIEVPAAAPGYINVVVPPSAGVISALVKVWSLAGVFPLADAEVALYGSQVGPAFIPVRSWNPAQEDDWVPIFGSCDFLRLYNHDTLTAGNSLYYSVIWGIEG